MQPCELAKLSTDSGMLGGRRPPWDAGSVSDLADLPDVLSFACPRCGEAAEERYYGPCTECRVVLRATLGGAQREVEAEAYEPKMNVTPNAVALKE